MSKSVIDALRVSLGVDSAQFSTGLKKAQTGLSSFGKMAAVGFAAVSAAAAVAGGAMLVLGKRSVDAADQMSKTAAKTGVTTESLSRLKYAADFAGVGFDGLAAGLRRVGQNIVEVANGSKGPAATAFQALGISVKEASGQLKSSDQVLSEVADRFARMENGSTKTALAIQLFGKSGADLIPLLNEGADGLKRYADESDRLGLTISSKTGKAAERFNDTLTRIGKIIEGVTMKVSAAALPAFQNFADLLASPAFAQAAETFGTTLINVFNAVTQAIVGVTNAARDLFNYLSRGSGVVGMSVDQLASEIAAAQAILADPNTNSTARNRSAAYLQQLQKQQAALQTRDPIGGGVSFSELGAFGFGTGGGGGGGLQNLLSGLSGGGTSEALAARLDALRQSLMTEEQLELDSYNKRLAEIQKFYEQGAILKGEHDSLIESAQQQHADRMLALAEQQAAEEARIRDMAVSGFASFFGSLGRLAEQAGEKNLGIAKAFGLAQVGISTAQGVMQALTLPPPASWAQAAAIAAQGALQASSIMSASRGSAGIAAVGSPAVAAPTPTSRTVNFNIQGDYVPTSSLGNLFQRLNDELGIDGLELVVNHKQA